MPVVEQKRLMGVILIEETQAVQGAKYEFCIPDPMGSAHIFRDVEVVDEETVKIILSIPTFPPETKIIRRDEINKEEELDDAHGNVIAPWEVATRLLFKR